MLLFFAVLRLLLLLLPRLLLLRCIVIPQSKPNTQSDIINFLGAEGGFGLLCSAA